MFKKINHPFNEVQRYQAQLPSKATLLMNHFGTAPGMWFYENDTVFVSMPGVPYEMKGLVTNSVIPKIQEQFKLPFIAHKTINTYGKGESVIAERLESWEDNLPDIIKLAYLPSYGKVRLRLSGKSDDEVLLQKILNQKTKELQELLSDVISGVDEDETIEKQIQNLCKAKGLTLSVAESLTGGTIASSLVSVPGASSFFKGGFITYSAELKKQLLNVSEETIKKYSVVSKEVALEMVIGAQQELKTDLAIAVTGNAGPTTDNNDKSVGTVFIAIADYENTEVHEFNFGQPREKVINRTVTKVFELLKNKLLAFDEKQI